jgi:hypothetical protein
MARQSGQPTYCPRCACEIDLDLPGRDRDGPAMGHIIGLFDGGDELDPDNVRLEHTKCNSAAENRQRVVRRREVAMVPTASRDW